MIGIPSMRRVPLFLVASFAVVLGIGILLIGLNSYNRSNQAQPIQLDGLYMNEVHNYQIHYPGGWQIAEHRCFLGKADVFLTAPGGSQKPDCTLFAPSW